MSHDPFSSSETIFSQSTHGLNSQLQRRHLGTVSFKPRGSSTVFTGVINNDHSLARKDKTAKYEGVLQFIEAIERETMTDSGSDLSVNDMMGRISFDRGSGNSRRIAIDQDMIFEKDPLAGVKMEHGNVWL